MERIYSTFENGYRLEIDLSTHVRIPKTFVLEKCAESDSLYISLFFCLDRIFDFESSFIHWLKCMYIETVLIDFEMHTCGDVSSHVRQFSDTENARTSDAQ